MSPTNTKTCQRCGIPKPLEQFHRNHRSAQGRLNVCKACRKLETKDAYWSNPEQARADAKKRYWSNPEQRRAKSRAWEAANPEKKHAYNKQWETDHPDKVAEQKKRMRWLYPERFAARRAVNHAIRDGKLPPIKSQLCVDCRSQPAQQYHHYKGYAREHWLDVKPLCRPCHVIADRAQS